MEHRQEVYYTEKDKNKGIRKMQKKGWAVMNIDAKKERPCGCILLGLFYFLIPKTTVWYVDYWRI